MTKEKLSQSAKKIQLAAIKKFGVCPIIEYDLPLHTRRELIEFATEIEEAAKQNHAPKWIPVNERLPLNYRRVLVLFDFEDLVRTIAIEYFDARIFLWSCANSCFITHWMELPPINTEEK